MADKRKPHYPYTSPIYSAERMGLYKIEKLIDIFTAALVKLDTDGGVSDKDYEKLIKELVDLKNNIRMTANGVKN